MLEASAIAQDALQVRPWIQPSAPYESLGLPGKDSLTVFKYIYIYSHLIYTFNILYYINHWLSINLLLAYEIFYIQ